jgi:3'-(hydroxy)phthioceranyl-2'-palmitoyl(stearoyl)-2-O-sulfo-trehalose (hydroxy)phthioceranyltransferase
VITVLCLAGFSGKPLLKDHLGGELFRSPFRRVDVNYNNRWFGQGNFDDGRAKAKSALLSIDGYIVGLGQSLGARIWGSLLDDPDVLAKVSPDRFVAVLTGHPDRKYGGASTVQYSGIQEGYGYSGVPDDCQYRVWDVARQYGAAEDYPTNRSVKVAVDNASLKVHEDYSNVSLGDPRNTVWDDPDNPNVRYILAPTYPLYHLEKSWYSLQRKADEDARQRPAIEKGYDRPFPAPKTTINRLFGLDYGYDGATRRIVRMPSPAPFRPFN